LGILKMVMRKIIKIDEDLCNGCGNCIPNCQEGALQIVDNKARLISDLFCDGLGACIGYCPQNAITIETREAQDYDERSVMLQNIIPKGENTIKAHLEYLLEHNAIQFYNQAVEVLKEEGIENPVKQRTCSSFKSKSWPIQMHLINVQDASFDGQDLLLAADCTGFSLEGFHDDYIEGSRLIIACPKLDNSAKIYEEKLVNILKIHNVKSFTVMIMEVPCCGGLLKLAKMAVKKSGKDVEIKTIIVGIDGNLKGK
jgi:ferredoxin